MDANTIIAISSIVTPLTVMVATITVARMQGRTNTNVNLGNLATQEVHDAVRTSNGQTIGELIESNEVRRVDDDPTTTTHS